MSTVDQEIVAIVGSRHYPWLTDVKAYVKSLTENSVVVSGGAIGVDSAAERAARLRGLSVISYRPIKVDGTYRIERTVFPAKSADATRIVSVRELHGAATWPNFASCAYARNWEIIKACTRAVVFRGEGKSNGTDHAIACCIDLDKPFTVFGVED